MEAIVDPKRDDWEAEAPEVRVARRARYQSLLHPGMDEKKKSVYEQALSLVPTIILQEDAIDHLKDNPKGDTPAAIAKTDVSMDKLRQARANLVERLKILMMACNHGWDLVNVVLDERKIGEDKEVAHAMEKLEKKKKEKEKEKDVRSTYKGYRGRRRYDDRRRYRSRSRSSSPRYRRRSRSRDRRSRSRERRRRDSSPRRSSNPCYVCGIRGIALRRKAEATASKDKKKKKKKIPFLF